jgi:hypothetical protein
MHLFSNLTFSCHKKFSNLPQSFCDFCTEFIEYKFNNILINIHMLNTKLFISWLQKIAFVHYVKDPARNTTSRITLNECCPSNDIMLKSSLRPKLLLRALHFSFSTLIVYWFTIDDSVISSRIMKKEAKICYVKID